MDRRLEDRVAVVTGGGAGIGAATCRRFAEEGAAVAVIDRNGDDAEATARRIETETDAAAVAVTADVGDEAAIERAAATVADRFGRADVLVNNAAIRVDPKPVTEADSADWGAIVDVNLMGAVHCSKHVIPLMDADAGGAVVNVASVGAHIARPGWAQYDATKGALLAMTRDMACDHARQNVRVNAISPGWIVTDYHLGDRSDAEREAYIEEKTARGGSEMGIMRRAARPVEVANAILFLASDEASFVTGTTLHVDGGASLGARIE